MSSPKARWLLRLPVLALAACGGDGNGDGGTDPGPLPGSVEVAASTTGENLDADGYTIALDGDASRTLGTDATATFEDVEPGDHVLELEGVATNCTVQGDSPRTVSVTAGATSETTFEVLCAALASPPAALAFTTSPGETELHQPIAGVEVTILDDEGGPVTGATNEVTVAIGVNPGETAPTEPIRPGELAGTTTVLAVDGVARFEDLRVDRRASGYTLVATAAGLEGAESDPFDVTFAWVEATAGRSHSCVLTPSGVAYCWGDNGSGQLGDGNAPADSHIPVAVATELRFKQLSAGHLHTCGLTPDGGIHCWGENGSGQLGGGHAGTDRDIPTAVEGGLEFVEVSTGNSHTCGLTASDLAYCWGDNGLGQLGDDNLGADSDVPVPVDSNLTFAAVSAGNGHTCALAGTDAYCWGDNGVGQLGDSTFVNSPVPVLVKGGHTILAVRAGTAHSCALAFAVAALCWGDNAFGQLGDGNSGTDSPVPVPVAGTLIFRTLSLTVGADHTCAISVSASAPGLYCWGRDAAGQLGNGAPDQDEDIPVLVVNFVAFSNAEAGSDHTCGVSSEGSFAFCWGSNASGQLGDGSGGMNRSMPVPLQDPPE